METATKRLYEAMFLVDSAQAASDWDGTLAAVNNILKRADAEVVMLRKWGDKKLAYEIDHKSRGMYILCYFKAEGGRIPGIERDVQLSEKVLRVLILSTEGRPAEDIERDIARAPAEVRPVEASPQAEEGPAPAIEASPQAEEGLAPAIEETVGEPIGIDEQVEEGVAGQDIEESAGSQ